MSSKSMPDTTIIVDYEHDCDALCPFTRAACRSNCMLMKPTASFGDPRCAFDVIANQLICISSDLKKTNEMLNGIKWRMPDTESRPVNSGSSVAKKRERSGR